MRKKSPIRIFDPPPTAAFGRAAEPTLAPASGRGWNWKHTMTWRVANMWSVGISVSPCKDAKRIGYDDRQINRIVIRLAQFFLNRHLRVIFGHDWRDDGVMRTVAQFANKVAAGEIGVEEKSGRDRLRHKEDKEQPRMLNAVPVGRQSLNGAALEAKRDSGGVLQVISTRELFWKAS